METKEFLKLSVVPIGAGLLAVSGVASAVDVADALAEIESAATAIAAVGAALIGAAALVMALKWVKAMFF